MLIQTIAPTNTCSERSSQTPPALRASDIRFLVRQAKYLRVPDNEIDDVIQDTLEIAVRLLPEFRGQAKTTTWLFVILRNTWCNYRRKIERRERKHSNYLHISEQQIGRQHRSYPERTLAKSLLNEFIEDLETSEGAVVTAVLIMGLSRAETATRLGVKPAAVDYRLRKAKLSFNERFVAS